MTDSVERLLVRIDASTEQLRSELKKAENAVQSSSNAMAKAQADMAKKMNDAFKGTAFFSDEGNARMIGAQADFARRLKAGMNASVNDAHAAALKMNEQFTFGSQWAKEIDKANSGYARFFRGVNSGFDGFKSGFSSANQYVIAHNNELKLMGAAAVGATALAIHSIVKYTDSYKNLQGQLKLVTGSQDELNRVYNATMGLAKETGSSLASTVNLYARLSRATETLGLTETERLRITESINKAMIVSGASAQESEAAIRQLSQGMASGVLRGEELNSVMENSPRLAKALADGLGVPLGQLRAMGKEGELTSDKVTGALLKMGDAIDSEFDKMPMTIARAMNSIEVSVSNAIGKADMSPLVDSIGDVEEALNDPNIIAGITEIASAIVSMTVDIGQGIAALGGMAKVLGETFAAGSFGPAADDMERITARIGFLKERLKELDGATGNAAANQKYYADELKKLEAVYALNIELTNRASNAVEAQAKSEKAAAAVSAAAGEQRQKTIETNLRLGKLVVGMTDAEEKAFVKLEKAQVKAEKAATASAKAQETAANKLVAAHKKVENQIARNAKSFKTTHDELDAMVDKTERYIEELNYETEQTKLSSREQEINNKVRAAGTALTAEQTARLREAAVATVDATAAMEASVKPWNDALQDMAASIDKGFSQAWTDAFSGAEDGFKGFANNMKEAFYNLLGNMAHMALTRPIVMQLSAAMGGLTGAAGAAAGTGATGTTGGISSMFSGGIGSMGASMYSGLGTMANDMGMFGVSNAFNAKALSTTGWTMGADMAGGFVGSLAAGKVFGETSGIGSAVGGIAGSALIPVPGLGAAIGSFIGAGLEKGLDNLFGQKNDGNNTGYSSFNLQKGTAVGGGVGKTYDQESVDAAQSLSQSLQLFATAIGGSSLTGRVDVGSKGIKYGNKEYGQDTEAFLQAAFDDVIRGSENLDSALKDLLIAFEGSAEETANYAQAMIMMSEAVQSNPVDVALSDMVSALESADAGISGSYYKQVDAVKDLIAKYDDSSAATVELNDALQTSRGMAYELATAILKMSDSIGTMLGDQAKYFREAVMSEDELRKARETQRDSLVTQLRTATDPQKVMELVNEFAEVNKQLFDSLNEEQRKAQVGTFTSLTAEVDTIAQSILGTALTDLKLSQDEINAQMMAAVTGAAGAMQQAADDIGGHIQTFGDYITLLVERGLKIQVDGGSLETV